MRVDGLEIKRPCEALCRIRAVLGVRLQQFRGPSVLAGSLAGVLLVAGCGAATNVHPPPGTAGSPQVISERGTVPQAESDPVASPPIRIRYPAAGMDVVVHALEPDAEAEASRNLVPPETMDGYWLSSFGSPGAGSSNTTYVIGHSWIGREAPFNKLSTATAPGDKLTVWTAAGNMDFQVDSVATYTKSTLRDSAVWAVVPNRLVLISCHTGDPQGKNVVITASPSLTGP